jgi:hypothetical protein
VKEKKCRNRIEQIEDGAGHACNSQISIEQTFIEFYTSLFTTIGANNIEACIRAITRKVTPKMNTQLEATFTAEEVYQALQQMTPLKALGPDGFSADFYQKKLGYGWPGGM